MRPFFNRWLRLTKRWIWLIVIAPAFWITHLWFEDWSLNLVKDFSKNHQVVEKYVLPLLSFAVHFPVRSSFIIAMAVVAACAIVAAKKIPRPEGEDLVRNLDRLGQALEGLSGVLKSISVSTIPSAETPSFRARELTRFVARRKYFGSIIYDREKTDYIPFDKDATGKEGRHTYFPRIQFDHR